MSAEQGFFESLTGSIAQYQDEMLDSIVETGLMLGASLIAATS